uniref:Galectin n=1 Tax=Cyprinus carpio TaxID=7962 RepID=A0A8C2DF11_CYPCA
MVFPIPWFNIVSFAPLSSVFSRFQVDLQYVSDIILHFNPRYERGGYVVHNTLKNGGWGSEERKYENPFPRDQPFALQTKSDFKMLRVKSPTKANIGHYNGDIKIVIFVFVDSAR